MYLIVYGEPTRQFFRNPADAAGGTANVAKHALLLAMSELNSKVSGEDNPENPNMSFDLLNDHGQVTALYPIPPHGSRVVLMDGSAIAFEGVVKGLSYNSPSVLTVQA